MNTRLPLGIRGPRPSCPGGHLCLLPRRFLANLLDVAVVLRPLLPVHRGYSAASSPAQSDEAPASSRVVNHPAMPSTSTGYVCPIYGALCLLWSKSLILKCQLLRNTLRHIMFCKFIITDAISKPRIYPAASTTSIPPHHRQRREIEPLVCRTAVRRR